MSLRLRRGTDAERQAVTFLEGELVYTTDTKKVFVGDGSTLGGVAIDSALGSIGTLTDVDISGVAIGQVLQWDGSAFVPGNADKESLYGADSTILVDAINSSINLNGTVKGDIIPDSNIAYDLGSAAARFRDLYLSGTSIDLGGTTISTAGGKVNFSAPVQAEFELNQNMDLKNYYITSTDTTPDISIRPGTNADFHVATVAGTKKFEVDLDTNTYGTPSGEKTVLQLPVFQTADYSSHSSDQASGQLVFDDPTKTLKVYNGSAWVTVQGSGGGGSGIVEGQTYDINITGDIVGTDSTIILDSSTSSIVIDDLTADTIFSNNIAGTVTGNLQGAIVGTDSSIIFDHITKTMNLATLEATGTVRAERFEGIISSDDSTTILDPNNRTANLGVVDVVQLNVSERITSNEIIGNLNGSVFADNSSVMVDGIANKLQSDTGDIEDLTTRILRAEIPTTGVTFSTDENTSRLVFEYSSDSAIANNTAIGRLVFQKDTAGTPTTEASISVTTDQITLFPSPGGVSNYNNYMKVYNNGKVQISMPGEITNAPTEHLEVGGNGLFTGTVTAASFKGSVVADDSSTIVDAISSTVSATIVATAGTAPTAASDPGDAGEIRFDNTNLYLKTPGGDWKKVALANLV